MGAQTTYSKIKKWLKQADVMHHVELPPLVLHQSSKRDFKSLVSDVERWREDLDKVWPDYFVNVDYENLTITFMIQS